jgi:flagellar basal body-associated protein FliL
VDTSTAFEPIRDHIKISAKESLGYYRLKHHKPLLNEGCSEVLDQKTRSQISTVTGSKLDKCK